MHKIVCSVCGEGPLCGTALYREKGALFNSGRSIRAIGPLYCAHCAPAVIKKAIAKVPWKVDIQTGLLQ